MDKKRKAVLNRIQRIEEAITKAHEYLDSGKHADSRDFRPLFNVKLRDGKILPPHVGGGQEVSQFGGVAGGGREEAIAGGHDGTPTCETCATRMM